jgi:hypothetical protein
MLGVILARASIEGVTTLCNIWRNRLSTTINETLDVMGFTNSVRALSRFLNLLKRHRYAHALMKHRTARMLFVLI